MIHNYNITFTHNVISNQTTYEIKHKNKTIRFEYIFGTDAYLELIYFFSLERITPSINLDEKTKSYTVTLSYSLYKYYKDFEDSLMRYLFKHRCEIV